MMVYRSIVVGLLAAIAAMLAARVTVPRAVPVPAPALAAAADAAPPGVSLVDVARRSAGDDPVPLLGLHPGEQVVEIDGVAAGSVELIGRWNQAFPGEYVDVTVASYRGTRRVLLLVHP